MEPVLYTLYNKKVASDRKTVQPIVGAFNEVNRRAGDIDYVLDHNRPIEAYHLTWLEEMERLLGQLQALSAILRAPQP
jgi:hypothetical protein